MSGELGKALAKKVTRKMSREQLEEYIANTLKKVKMCALVTSKGECVNEALCGKDGTTPLEDPAEAPGILVCGVLNGVNGDPIGDARYIDVLVVVGGDHERRD